MELNIKHVKPILHASQYIDIALKKSREEAARYKGMAKKQERDKKEKQTALIAIKEFNAVMSEKLLKIMKSFPIMDELPEFYKELFKASIDYVQMKKSLGAIAWAKTRTNDFYRSYFAKIRRENKSKLISKHKKEFIGRSCSLMKQVEKDLVYIEQCRKIVNSFPIIKNMPTAAIAGFPNVGKSTLLSKITKAKPEIKEYAFTTKNLNVGYMEVEDDAVMPKIQIIDTPGTLDRFEKMNSIEKQACLALKHCADVIIYIFDLTEPYPLGVQEKLFETMKQYHKPVLSYLSKTDILEKEVVDRFRKKHKAISNIECVKEEILRLVKK